MSSEAHLEALLEIINTSAHQAIAEYKKGGNDVPTIYAKTNHPIDFAIDTIPLKKAVKLLEGACQQLCASLAPPQHTVNNFVQSFEWACVGAVIRAKVADVLEKYPKGLHVDELAKLVNVDKEKLSRSLRLLATKGCFVEVEPHTFANNRISLATLSSSDTAAIYRMDTEDVAQGAAAMYEAMVEPEGATSYVSEMAPLSNALKKNGNYFEVWKDVDKRENFHRAMIGFNQISGSLSILHRYPWSKVKTFCDVGAGIGAVSLPLAKMHPHLKITIQDLPEVLAQAKEVWAMDAPGALQNKQVEFVPLNFFEESPVQGCDLYYLRNIIHDWPDTTAEVIITSIRKAMTAHSRLLIHDFVLALATRDPNAHSVDLDVAPEPLLPNFGNGNNKMYQQDLLMWMKLNGKERTLREFIALGSAAGLQLDKVYDLADSAVLEFRLGP